jgi:hypothetical protein
VGAAGAGGPPHRDHTVTGLGGAELATAGEIVLVALEREPRAPASGKRETAMRSHMLLTTCFQVANECMEYRWSEECEDCEPYFDLSLFGEDWQGQVYDTLSSDLREF